MTQPEQPTADDPHLTFAVSLSTDRDGFLRRACAACGREFKTEISPADLQWELSAQCQRMGLEVGEREKPPSQQEALRCPFCGHEAEGSEMHTAETVEYLQRLVYRDYLLPTINRTFSGLEDSFGRSGRSSGRGLFSMSVTFKHDRAPLPPRPIHGPDPPDMKVVEFLCCDKRIKVPERWDAVEACTYCKTPVRLV